ncbi:hypothetical protein Ddye_025513 [Dipteronia dyeriana]|uniref:Reverse transcriptase domain-containing protein n=1 Tax=Dipteronia dyeriana TaxID=168575 RepID=A0AAD9TLB7_9ROSI|nr:hypothetical protein Ddye_025513 [Dipteronia dyeriana]
MWTKHNNFANIIRDSWNSQGSNVSDFFFKLSNMLTVWNRETFGNLFYNKKRTFARLQGVQHCLSSNYRASLATMEEHLIKEYNNIIEQEELFWLQKSRNCWLKEGDRNIKKFHLSTLVRRRRNKLEGLKNEDGVWTQDKEEMKDVAIRYFKKLFTANDSLGNFEQLPLMFLLLRDETKACINTAVGEDEVQQSLFGIGSLKAPGPYGFPAGFFQKYWNVCKCDLIKMVQYSFETGVVPVDINQTLITLVPKTDCPMEMSQLRPISLCNTTYKVISKIIVQRLRHLLPNIISPNQVAFVPGRQIQDNIVVAQEVLHKLKTSKGRSGYFAWKIDLAKAYDRLQWNFIWKVLGEVGIDGKMADLIMNCVSSVQYRIVLNGEVTTSFTPGSDIRQVTPYPPTSL